jgi:hypothetical protein
VAVFCRGGVDISRKRYIAALSVLVGVSSAATAADDTRGREILDLNGEWQICEATGEDIPDAAAFTRTVPVPGLVDLASPSFPAVGTRGSSRHRDVFWYRRTFKLDRDVPRVAFLKLHKVRYGCRAYLNGVQIGKGSRNFTPHYFDATTALKGGGAANELMIRVGADRRPSVAAGVPDGKDKEKTRYIPGIFDDVELILTGMPYIETVQVAPCPADNSILVQTSLSGLGRTKDNFSYRFEVIVREAMSGKVVASAKEGTAKRPYSVMYAGRTRWHRTRVSIPNARLWTPRTPFLYLAEVRVATPDGKSGDSFRTRFGMRDFRFAPDGTALLNGKPYPLLGTNICMYRFFEDPRRGSKPWDKEWVRRVIRGFRAMNWNSCRFCIGFPPEIWYETADEEGLLVQDEYPLWTTRNWPKWLTAQKLLPCFLAWMRERWNHPCVVIWDAQNESWSRGVLDEVVPSARGWDLSDRPWDVGWQPAMRSTDPCEWHNYYWLAWKSVRGKKTKCLQDMRNCFFQPEKTPMGQPNGSEARIINEYGWLWLNRDGSPSKLSKLNYDFLLPGGSTVEERRDLYARYLAMMTELYRHQTRVNVAGIMHFCALTFSDPKTAYTGDNYVELDGPTFDPLFVRYVRDSFAPVGLMIDLWGKARTEVWGPRFVSGATVNVPVMVKNDSGGEWSGEVVLKLTQDGRDACRHTQELTVADAGRGAVTFAITCPESAGVYELIAELKDGGKAVRSYRRVEMVKNSEQ